MNENFLSLELSQELVDLGFGEECYALYRQYLKYTWYDQRKNESIEENIGNPIRLSTHFKPLVNSKVLCKAILYQQALVFLDNLGYSISVEQIDNSRGSWWEYSYKDAIDRDYCDESLMDSSKLIWNTEKYYSRQEAWTAGIKQVLTKIDKKDEK